MNKLILAAAAILAATLFSGSAFAVTEGTAKALHAGSSVVKVHIGCRHRTYHHARCGGPNYPACARCYGCGGCGLYTYPSAYRCGYGYTGYGCGCGCGHGCGCGYSYYGCGTGGGFFGWLF
jgi:hypothetical protein